jgi:hypothetical protein
MGSSCDSPIYPSVHSSARAGPHSYTGAVASWAFPRASFIPSPRWQSPQNYAPMIVPQGLVQVPSWNSYPVSSFPLVMLWDDPIFPIMKVFAYYCPVNVLGFDIESPKKNKEHKSIVSIPIFMFVHLFDLLQNVYCAIVLFLICCLYETETCSYSCY